MSDAELSPGAEKKLLQLARESVDAALNGRPLPQEPLDDPELQAQGGAFVTIKIDGELRGCLGQFTADIPIYQLVRQMARASATEDPRFFHLPLRPEDLPRLRLEISALSPMRRLENPLDLELGKHGIYIKHGGQSGTFLPQVATEYHMSKEEFLSSCCAHKAGLPRDAWKDPKTEVYVYSAQVFHEAE